MNIQIEYIEDSNTANEMLFYCTIIAKAFSDALDQNECNLKVPIGFDQEIRNIVRDIEYINNLINLDSNKVTPTPVTNNRYVFEQSSYIPNRTITETQSLSSYLKENCFECDLGLPDININDKLDWSFNKLKTYIQLYTDVFDQLANPNFCHAAYAFQYTCVPDIVKLIALLLSVYVAILSLRKLSGVSLNAFIKGIISGLLGQIISSFNIQIDFSKTGIGCILNLLEEISTNLIPDGENLRRQLNQDTMDELNLDSEHRSPLNNYIDQLQKQTNNTTNDISNEFKKINSTVQQATEDFNDHLSSIFGLIDYLQCEAMRSGTDFIEILDYLNRLVNIINLLSSIAAMIAKRQILNKLCTTETSLAELRVLPKEDLYTPIQELEVVDVIEEYLGKVIELTEDENDDIIPIIYDKDKETILPKLNFFTCNLTDFIHAHSIDNITNRVIEEIIIEQEKVKNSNGINNNPNRNIQSSINIESISNNRNNWSRYPIEYIRPTFIDPSQSSEEEKSETASTINTNKENALQSILDFVYNNPLDRQKIQEEVNTKINPDKSKDLSIPSNLNRQPSIVENTNQSVKTSIENQCRHIEDVLNQLKNI